MKPCRHNDFPLQWCLRLFLGLFVCLFFYLFFCFLERKKKRKSMFTMVSFLMEFELVGVFAVAIKTVVDI